MVTIKQVSGLRVTKGRVAWSTDWCSSAQGMVFTLLFTHLAAFKTVQQLLVQICLALFHLFIKMNIKALFVLLCAIIISVHAKKKREPAKGSRKYLQLFMW